MLTLLRMYSPGLKRSRRQISGIVPAMHADVQVMTSVVDVSYLQASAAGLPQYFPEFTQVPNGFLENLLDYRSVWGTATV